MLRREVFEACRRRGRLVLPVVAIACAWAAWRGCRWGDRVEVRTVREVITVPVPVAFEQPVQIPAQPARCPLPRTDAPLVQPKQPPEAVVAVRPSPTNAGWVAAWSMEHVFVSRDAGRSWTRVLDGTGDVADVSFDCFGRVIAVRGKRVGLRDGEVERWRTVPLVVEDGARVFGGGPDIAVIARPKEGMGTRLALSRDGGETWSTRALSPYWEREKMRGRQYEDGTIRGAIPVTDCDYYALFVFRLHDGTLDYDEHARYQPKERLFRKTEDGAWYEAEFDDSVDGPVPLFARDWIVADPETAAGDAAGHIWSVRCGKLAIATVRATRGSGPRDESSAAADAAGCDPS